MASPRFYSESEVVAKIGLPFSDTNSSALFTHLHCHSDIFLATPQLSSVEHRKVKSDMKSLHFKISTDAGNLILYNRILPYIEG